jgi:hypothetical protein
LKAQAKSLRSIAHFAADARVENIVLDGELETATAPDPQQHRNTVHSYRLACSPTGSFTALSILEGHYLGVYAPGPRKEPVKYQFDMRFAEPTPIRVRRLPWFWLLIAAFFAAFGSGALHAALLARNFPGLVGGVVAMAISIAAVYVALRRTTESLQFRSVHGLAALVSVTGGFGSARRHRNVFAVLTRNVHAAKNARPQEQPQFLRDEMREHHRLRQMGVLSEKDYEASKARILAAHRPAK